MVVSKSLVLGFTAVTKQIQWSAYLDTWVGMMAVVTLHALTPFMGSLQCDGERGAWHVASHPFHM